MISTDYDKFMKDKSIYIWKKIMMKVSKKYYSKIEIFIKQKTDYLLFHYLKDLEIWLMKEIMLSFIWNYKSMIVEKLNAVKKYLDEHLEKSIICSSFLFAATFILLTRKSDDDLRFCVNYWALNIITIKNYYSIFFIKKTLNWLCKVKIYIKLDVIVIFNQICIKKNHEWMTAFNTHYDQFEYLIMSFELCNALSNFQNYINEIIYEYLDMFCSVYLNDVLIYNDDENKHMNQISLVNSQGRASPPSFWLTRTGSPGQHKIKFLTRDQPAGLRVWVG